MLKEFTVALGVVFLGAVTGYAQTPTLALARGNTGISSNENGRASDFNFQMEASGWPRAVSTGESIFMMGSWPNGNNPTITDDKSNTWRSAVSCNDSSSMSHGFFYAVNSAADTSMITETHSSAIGDGVFDWAHFYNMSTTASGFVDGSSCKTGVTPSNNTAPNISGTTYTTATSGDLILTCVYVEGTLGQISATQNAVTSITWPTGFIGLSEEPFYGHACAYGVQTTAGSFTPTFTIAQGTHNSFTITSAAFKAGSGGTAPGNGASILLSEMHYSAALGQTDTVYLPCPNGTTNVTVMAEVGGLTSVSDSNGNTFHSVTSPSGQASIYYVNAPTIAAGTYRVNVTANIGGYELYGLFCIGNTAGIDTAATAKNSSTLDGAGSGTTYNYGTMSSSTIIDAPSIGTSVAGDLVLDSGPIGVGPATGCVPGQCVFDYVGSTSWTSGDGQSYSNGDLMGHYYASTAGTVNFQYDVVPTGAGWSGMAIALKPANSSQGPAPPTGLSVIVR